MKQLTSVKYIVPALALVIFSSLGSQAQAAGTFITANIDGYSSAYPGGGYNPSNLFDGTPAVGSSSGLGGDYASDGLYPVSDQDPVVKFSLDSATTLVGLGYAQRGDVTSYGAGDVVTQIDLYFVSELTYDAYTPAAGSSQADVKLALGSPSEVINPSTTNINFDAYSFGSSAHTQYIIAQFIGTTGNPGGAELRFETPEPATYLLLGLGVAALLLVCRRFRKI